MATITKRLDANGKPYYTAQVRLLKEKDTATFKRITDAKKWVQDTESAIREGRWFKTVEAKKHTVKEMLDRYCTEYHYQKIKTKHTAPRNKPSVKANLIGGLVRLGITCYQISHSK